MNARVTSRRQSFKKDEIEEWLMKKRIPIIHSAHRAENRFSDCAFRYEFWTSGTFHADAAHLLHTAKAATTKYQIDWKDGAALKVTPSRSRLLAFGRYLTNTTSSTHLPIFRSWLRYRKTLPRLAINQVEKMRVNVAL